MIERTVYAIRREDGKWYSNNRNYVCWVGFDQAKIFTSKATATAAAKGTNHACARNDQKREAVAFTLTLKESE